MQKVIFQLSGRLVLSSIWVDSGLTARVLRQKFEAFLISGIIPASAGNKEVMIDGIEVKEIGEFDENRESGFESTIVRTVRKNAKPRETSGAE